MAANSKRTAPTWQWTARSSQPSRRIGGSRQPGSIGDPVRPPGDDAGCARACLRSARACVPDTCSAQPTTRRHGSVTQLPSGRSGCAGRIVKSGGLIRDIHAALSQLPVSPIIHIMSSNPDSGLPAGAGWILSAAGVVQLAHAAPAHTRGPTDPARILASRVRNCAGGTSTCARHPTHAARCRSPAAPTPDGHRRSWPDIARIRVGGVAQTPALCDDTRRERARAQARHRVRNPRSALAPVAVLCHEIRPRCPAGSGGHLHHRHG